MADYTEAEQQVSEKETWLTRRLIEQLALAIGLTLLALVVLDVGIWQAEAETLDAEQTSIVDDMGMNRVIEPQTRVTSQGTKHKAIKTRRREDLFFLSDPSILAGFAINAFTDGAKSHHLPHENNPFPQAFQPVLQTQETVASSLSLIPFALGATVEPAEVHLGVLTTVTYTVIYSGVRTLDLTMEIPDVVQLDLDRLPAGFSFDTTTRNLMWSDDVTGPEKVTFRGFVSDFLLADSTSIPREITAEIEARSANQLALTTPAIFRLRQFHLH